uniref:Galectin n=1 Tax=Varanus komodoensis TaxID=61221 RepID=A0A8D2II01_VARKO
MASVVWVVLQAWDPGGLGSNELSLLLHFNPQFQGEDGTIVYNSMTCRQWDEELQDTRFPFWPEEETKIRIIFDAKEVTERLPEEYEFQFPNRLGLEIAEYLSLSGDFHVKAIKFE